MWVPGLKVKEYISTGFLSIIKTYINTIIKSNLDVEA